MILKSVAVILWGVAGTLTLCGCEVRKSSYALVWIALMINLFVDMLWQ